MKEKKKIYEVIYTNRRTEHFVCLSWLHAFCTANIHAINNGWPTEMKSISCGKMQILNPKWVVDTDDITLIK